MRLFFTSLATVAAGLTTALAYPATTAQQQAFQAPTGLWKDKLTLDGLLRHSRQLQKIADEHGGTRVFGSAGHNATLRYIVESCIENGYQTFLEPMILDYAETLREEAWIDSPVAEYISINLMSYTTSTPVEGIEAELAVIRGVGCEGSDYPDTVKGQIVLVQRGECTFGQKAYVAGQAGASALLIANNEDGPLHGTLGQDFPSGAPTAGISKQDAEKLVDLVDKHEEPIVMTVAIVEKREPRLTHNVIAETQGGNHSNVIVIGAHSDSVAAGPGINDNGSGTAALLELSYLFRDVEPENAVRFCWWTAEEFGLLGAKYHVDHMPVEEREKIALYLNFDMIASPNAYNGIYDGDGSDSPLAGPPGSAAIEKLFQDFFESQGEPYDPSEFDGRSDYGPFIAAGIPSGGLFTGAEVKMTEEQAKRYGREAGVPYDKCYHQACDTIDNLNHEAFLLHARGLAHALDTFSRSTKDLEQDGQAAKADNYIDLESIWPSGTMKGIVSI